MRRIGYRPFREEARESAKFIVTLAALAGLALGFFCAWVASP